jgi:hypothetical protein
MIPASTALFQTATNGIRAVTASTAIVKLIWSGQNIFRALMKYGIALADLAITFSCLISCHLKKSRGSLSSIKVLTRGYLKKAVLRKNLFLRYPALS